MGEHEKKILKKKIVSALMWPKLVSVPGTKTAGFGLYTNTESHSMEQI